MPTLDASTPAGPSQANNSITTPSFTPPLDAVLVVNISSDGTPPVSFNCSSTPALVFTQRRKAEHNDGGAAAIFTAPVTSSVPYTVSVNNSSSGRLSVKVDVWTGVDTASPVGAGFALTAATNNWSPTFTSTAAGSRGVGCAVDWNALGSPTSTDIEAAWHVAGLISGLSAYKASDTATPGTVVSINFDAFGTGTPQWSGVGVELKPAAGAGGVVDGTATLAFTAALTAAGKRTVAVSGTWGYGGVITGTGKRIVNGTSALLGGGGITGLGDKTVGGTSVLAGGGVIAGAGLIGGAPTDGQASFGFGGTIAAIGTRVPVVVSGQASLALGGAVVVDPHFVRAGQASVQAGGTLTALVRDDRPVDIRPRRRQLGQTVFPENWPEAFGNLRS